MMNFFISLSAVLIYLAAAYGWGRLVVGRFYADYRPGWTFTIVFGLGVWIFVGGLLNAARLAFPNALDAMLGAGLVLALAPAWASVGTPKMIVANFHDWRARFRKTSLPDRLSFVLVAFVCLFLVSTLMPARAFNFHDDFYTYLPRPVRMLQTGSLGGNPFEVLGADSLGAQAFMQSFFVDHLPLDYINAFDAICCFVLGLFLLREIGRRFGVHWIFLLASLLTFIVINPQYVNVSSLYSGSLMILAAVFASIVFAEGMGGADRKGMFAGATGVALFLTSLVTLKTTFAVFAVAYFAVHSGCVLYLGTNRSGVTRSIFFVVLAAVILATPWILVSLPNYSTALRIALEGSAPAVTGGGDGWTGFISKLVTVFSLEKGWGGSFLKYSLLASLLALAGSASLYRLIKSRDILYRQRLSAISAACLAAAVGYFSNVYLLDPDNAVRYSIPILIAVTSASLLFAGSGLMSSPGENFKRSPVASAAGVAALGVTLVIGGVFSGDLVDRGKRAYQQRTLLSFPVSETHLAYNDLTLGKSTETWVRGEQDKAEAGRAILAFIAFPFHLDFSRNPVFTVNESVFMTPWSDFPLNGDAETARRYLGGLGIRYVMYQYRGPTVKSESELQSYASSAYWIYRKAGETNTRFRKVMRDLVENSRLVDAGPGFVMMDISRKTPLPYPIPWSPN